MNKNTYLIAIILLILASGCTPKISGVIEHRLYSEYADPPDQFWAVNSEWEEGSVEEMVLIYDGSGTYVFEESVYWPDKSFADLGYSADGISKQTPGSSGWWSTNALDYHGHPPPSNNGVSGYKCVGESCVSVSSGAQYATIVDCITQCGNSTNDPCIVGTWTNSICGGSYTATLTFSSDGSGSLNDYDCTGQCSRYVPFTWVDNGSYCTLNYGSGTLCGQPFNPTGGDQPYTCSGNTLMFGNEYTRQ